MELIVAVEPVRSRYRIRLDNGEALWFTRSLLEERPLEADDLVDVEELKNWLLLRQYRPALEKAVKLLAQRPHSQGEIRQKLLAAGYMDETADMVLCKLGQNGLVNDEDFAGQWAEHRAGMRYGPRRIHAELKRKGLKESQVEAALDSIPVNTMLENAQELIRRALKRRKPGENLLKFRQRTLAALIRRGFDWDIARQAWESESNDPEDPEFPDE